jgi:hypothetical protein
VLVGWLQPEEFHALAVASATHLLGEPLGDETIDILCVITEHEALRDDFGIEQIPARAFSDPRGLRLLACLAPSDPRVPPRVLPALAPDGDAARRQWAAHAFTRLAPGDEAVLLALVPYVNDPSPEVASRIRWLLQSRPLPPAVARAAAVADPSLVPTPAHRRWW